MLHRNCTGFTLLEVLVALAVVGMSLGTVFALSAGSKRLALAALEDVRGVMVQRSALNAAQVRYQPEIPQYPIELATHVQYVLGELEEKPERQTQNILYVLENYQIECNAESFRCQPVSGVRWKRLTALQ